MKYTLLALLFFTLFSCNRNQNSFDASGSFETEETIISSEATGRLEVFNVEEGQTLKSGDIVGSIDSTQLYLKKKQLESQVKSTLSQKPNIAAQIAALQIQLSTAEREQKRLANLVKAEAATQKQLDDATSQVDMIKKQLEAQQSSLNITTESINQQTNPLQVQIEQINDQLSKCRLVNPVNGTVLTKYAEEKEMTAVGKALYKIADVSALYLRAYISGAQLSQVKLNQSVTVSVDDGEKKFKQYSGTITWISDKAEFTPKTIQTKEERSNMVYAIKVKVKNDGALKIGMYGEVKFQ
ncbi:MAG TPA: HlyD family efflux transporter periplasmic adaptor subunit [Bacteroidia bacterium]|nr:HlyD family efflux transporter periplasmic adaptor subunit [Bacteroidia bacterium]HNP98209.1 HlyD family efflux transporter periplasmic adaptor subunit [Bacteroidia bacterium]